MNTLLFFMQFLNGYSVGSNFDYNISAKIPERQMGVHDTNGLRKTDARHSSSKSHLEDHS